MSGGRGQGGWFFKQRGGIEEGGGLYYMMTDVQEYIWYIFLPGVFRDVQVSSVIL